MKLFEQKEKPMWMATENRKATLILLAVISLVTFFIGVLVGISSNPPSVPPDVLESREKAYDAISRSEWGRAQSLFERCREMATRTPVSPQIKDEIEGSLKMLVTIRDENGHSPQTGVSIGTKVEIPRSTSSVPAIPSQILVGRFPKGKTVRSVAHFYVSGTGSNSEWGIKDTAHFNYLSQISMETKVIENDPQNGRLVFEQTFGVTMQELIVADQQLELVPPDSLPIRLLWPTADTVLRGNPTYVKLRGMVTAINLVDPNLKRSLTTIHTWLKKGGVDLRPTDDVLVKALLDKVTGAKFRVVYESGVGVTEITPLSDDRFERGELIRLARSCNVVLDYFVFPDTQKKPGDKWTVDASQIGSLFAFYGPIAKFDGRVSFLRGDDNANGEAILGITGGTLHADANTDNRTAQSNVVVRDGTVIFNLKEQFIRQAKVTFSAEGMIQSRDHLLFGTDRMRDLQIESRYQAELVDD